MNDEMISKKKFNPGDKFILEIGEKRMALDEYEIVGTDLWVWGSLLEKLTPYEPDHIAEVGKMVNGDVVSRREATQTILEFIVEYLGGAFDENLQKKLIERINALSFAEPEQRWIPCSERMPKKHGESYLVTISDGAVYTTTLQWDANGKRWYLSFFNDGNILVDFIDDVIAWLPLPEPYQAERWE